MTGISDFTESITGLHGAVNDLPAKFREQAVILQQVQARGEKKMRFSFNGQEVSSALSMGGDGTTTSPAGLSTTNEIGPGPDTGYVWSLSELNVEGLSSGDVVGIYRNSSATQGHLIWILTQNQPCQTWGKGQKILFYGDKLYVANIGTFSATGVVTVSGVASQVPAERIYTLI